MRVILLERIEKLGIIGDVVEVKAGYSRNYLLPKGKAIRATATNLEFFASKKSEIEATNLHHKAEAEKVAAKMTDVSLIVVRQASESGFLFGSVRSCDISASLAELGFVIAKSQVRIGTPIKLIGNHVIKISLHPEVVIDIPLRIVTAQEHFSAANQHEVAQAEAVVE